MPPLPAHWDHGRRASARASAGADPGTRRPPAPGTGRPRARWSNGPNAISWGAGVRSRSAADDAGLLRRPFAHDLKRVDQVLEAEGLGEHSIEAGREGIGSDCRAGIRT